MSKLTESLALELIGLPVKDRAALAKRLLDSLDEEKDDSSEALWYAEAQQRLDECHLGGARLRDVQEVIREAHDRYR